MDKQVKDRNMNRKYIFHVISNTHWDREWRFPFQRNRQSLVEMIDSLLDILQRNPDYRAFHLDSQSIVLGDYLEIKPHNRPLITKLVEDGRLLIGPWFILPDEFQVGGESLVRNLLLGHRIAREFGHVMKVGYSPFSWGQISQLPQIYKEFGIDLIMFYRGVNSIDSPKAEFLWEGADGTRLLTSRFSTMPRYNFYFYIYRPVIHNEGIPDIEYTWNRGGTPFHFADAQNYREDYALVRPNDEYHRENLKPAVEAIIRDQVDDFTTEHIFWAEGHDSSGPNAKTVEIINDINKFMEIGEVKHSTLEEYAVALRHSVNNNKLKIVTGERRSAQYDNRSGNMYGYTISARMYLKQINFRTEKLLQFYAEPFNCIANMLGLDTNDRYLDKAWNLLLQNSAHDSIGGCSLDEIHDDMLNRYKQCMEITDGVFARACRFLAGQIGFPASTPHDIHLVAINPLTFLRSEIVEGFIDIPTELDRGSFNVRDSSGAAIPIQIMDQADVEPILEQLIDRPMYFRMKRYRCYIDLRNVPALGFRTLRILPVSSSQVVAPPLARLINDLPVLENDLLKICLNPNGTLDVEDKRNHQQFRQLAYFYDEGEAGHAWTHVPVEPFVTTLDSAPSIEIIENGALSATVRVRHQLQVSKDLDGRNQDDPQTVLLPIEMKVQLRKDSGRVEIELDIDNTAESHRLRMMFPTGIDAEYSYGEGQFDVVKRSVLRPDTSHWIEQPMYDFPMHHFVDVSDGERGGAVLVDGLKEYEWIGDCDGTLAITLLRAFRYVIQPGSVQDYSYQKGSQCPGPQHTRLAFYPHTGDWRVGKVYPEALSFNTELRLFQMGNATGKLPPETSFLQIEPVDLIFSSLKPAEDGQPGAFILRCYNPTGKVINGLICFYFPLQSAWQVTLEEITIREMEIIDRKQLKVAVDPGKIYSIRIFLEN